LGGGSGTMKICPADAQLIQVSHDMPTPVVDTVLSLFIRRIADISARFSRKTDSGSEPSTKTAAAGKEHIRKLRERYWQRTPS